MPGPDCKSQPICALTESAKTRLQAENTATETPFAGDHVCWLLLQRGVKMESRRNKPGKPCKSLAFNCGASRDGEKGKGDP